MFKISSQFIKLIILVWAFCCVLAAHGSVLFPEKQQYPSYLADPTAVTFNAQTMYFDSTAIAQTGKRRVDLKLGASLPIYETRLSDQIWQLTLIGGFHGQFDSENSQDNIGWDGIYGIDIASRLNDSLAVHFGMKHISSHIGDEYAERTGRLRVNYTRQEVRAGVAWHLQPSLIVYTDLAYGYDLRNDALQEPWRIQIGGQYYHPAAFMDNRARWYGAVDISSYEENNWHKNYTVQTGLAIQSGLHLWRIGLEYYDGKAQIGEFFQDQERYISLGVWFDI